MSGVLKNKLEYCLKNIAIYKYNVGEGNKVELEIDDSTYPTISAKVRVSNKHFEGLGDTLFRYYEWTVVDHLRYWELVETVVSPHDARLPTWLSYTEAGLKMIKSLSPIDLSRGRDLVSVLKHFVPKALSVQGDSVVAIETYKRLCMMFENVDQFLLDDKLKCCIDADAIHVWMKGIGYKQYSLNDKVCLLLLINSLEVFLASEEAMEESYGKWHDYLLFAYCGVNMYAIPDSSSENKVGVSAYNWKHEYAKSSLFSKLVRVKIYPKLLDTVETYKGGIILDYDGISDRVATLPDKSEDGVGYSWVSYILKSLAKINYGNVADAVVNEALDAIHDKLTKNYHDKLSIKRHYRGVTLYHSKTSELLTVFAEPCSSFSLNNKILIRISKSDIGLRKFRKTIMEANKPDLDDVLEYIDSYVKAADAMNDKGGYRYYVDPDDGYISINTVINLGDGKSPAIDVCFVDANEQFVHRYNTIIKDPTDAIATIDKLYKENDQITGRELFKMIVEAI